MTSDAQTMQPPPPRAGGRLARAGWIALPLFITAVAGFFRFWRLSSPHKIVPLDETYYAPNSFGYLCHGSDMTFRTGAKLTCSGLDPAFAVHPPVGKLLTAIGIKIFGYRPFGWRFAAAVVGTLSILLVYGIARRLWTSRWPAVVASVLVAADGLFFVQSRLAMLDIFVAFFVLLGVWLLLEDRARAPGWVGARWWRLASGVAFGLAIASKWAAAPMLPVVAAVALAWEAVRIRDERAAAVRATKPAGEKSEWVTPGPEFWGPESGNDPGTRWIASWPRRAVARTKAYLRHTFVERRMSVTFQAFAAVATFAIIPVLVYFASYTPWFLSTKRYVPPRCNNVVAVGATTRSVPKSGIDLWLCDQKEIFDYHRNLKAVDDKGKPIHPYMSKAWSWPWISRPASHYFETFCDPGRKAGTPCPAGTQLRDEEILGLPNPAIWWFGFFAALPACVFWMVKRRDEVAALLIVLFAPLVVPWFVYSRPIFMFYMTPALPFLVLMVVHALQKWRLRWSAVAFVAVAISLFGYFYPVLAAVPLPPSGATGWESRIWFGHVIRGDCTSERIKLLCWI